MVLRLAAIGALMAMLNTANAQTVDLSANSKTPPLAQGDTPAASTAPAPVGAGGLMVFIDPATGKIIQPDAAQVNDLVGRLPQSKTPFVPKPFASAVPGGGVGVLLDESFHSYMVVTRRPDASMVMDCLQDADQVADAIAHGLKTGEILYKKAVLDVQ